MSKKKDTARKKEEWNQTEKLGINRDDKLSSTQMFLCDFFSSIQNIWLSI